MILARTKISLGTEISKYGIKMNRYCGFKLFLSNLVMRHYTNCDPLFYYTEFQLQIIQHNLGKMPQNHFSETIKSVIAHNFWNKFSSR